MLYLTCSRNIQKNLLQYLFIVYTATASCIYTYMYIYVRDYSCTVHMLMYRGYSIRGLLRM
jgi:hypothetical protein